MTQDAPQDPPLRPTQRRFLLPALLLLLIAATFPLALPGWFHGDDAITLTDAAAVLQDPLAAFYPGTFGRFRPLRLYSIAAIYAFAGTSTALPYHLLSLVLHALNMLLMLRLLRRLLLPTAIPGGNLIPFAATAIAAVHWAGSEAVTYLSAIGILFSTTGALVCCLAVRNLAESRPNTAPRRGALLQLAAGMLITIGGGYVLPTLGVALLCALWPLHTASRRLLWRALLPTAAIVVPFTLAWAILEKLFIVRDFAQQARFDPLFMLYQFGEILARLYLPSAFVNEPIVLAFLAVVALCVIVLRPLRDTFRRPRVWLLLALSIAAVLPYAPSALGNRDRFCYLPAAFFMAFLLELTLGALQHWPRATPTLIRRALWVSLVVFLAINVAAVQLRVASANRRGDALRQFIAKVNDLKTLHRDRKIHLYMTGKDPEQGLTMLRLTGTLSGAQTSISPPPKSLPADEARFAVTYQLKTGFTIQPISPDSAAH